MRLTSRRTPDPVRLATRCACRDLGEDRDVLALTQGGQRGEPAPVVVAARRDHEQVADRERYPRPSSAFAVFFGRRRDSGISSALTGCTPRPGSGPPVHHPMSPGRSRYRGDTRRKQLAHGRHRVGTVVLARDQESPRARSPTRGLGQGLGDALGIPVTRQGRARARHQCVVRAVAQHPSERRCRLNPARLRAQTAGRRRERRRARPRSSRLSARRIAGTPGRRCGQDRGHRTHQGGAGLVAGGDERDARARDRRRHDPGGVTPRSGSRKTTAPARARSSTRPGARVQAMTRARSTRRIGRRCSRRTPRWRQPLVRQLVDADLRIRARVADLEAHDLPRRGVRGQRCGGVHVQSPLPHAEQVHAPHVGQARTQARQAPQEARAGPPRCPRG